MKWSVVSCCLKSHYSRPLIIKYFQLSKVVVAKYVTGLRMIHFLPFPVISPNERGFTLWGTVKHRKHRNTAGGPFHRYREIRRKITRFTSEKFFFLKYSIAECTIQGEFRSFKLGNAKYHAMLKNLILLPP